MGTYQTAQAEEEDAKGRIYFEVINGWWNGSVKNDVVRLECHDRSSSPGTIVWSGNAPFSDGAYNEAIEWIQNRINGKPQEPPELPKPYEYKTEDLRPKICTTPTPNVNTMSSPK